MVIYTLGNFWEANPQYLLIKELKNLYDKYGKRASSEIMKAIYLYCDFRSIFAKIPKEARLEEVLLETKLDNSILEATDVRVIIENYDIYFLTPAQASFKLWQDKMVERANFIKSQPYDENTFEMLDKLMVNSSKIWEMFLKVKKELEAEEDAGGVRGGNQLSASDLGQI